MTSQPPLQKRRVGAALLNFFVRTRFGMQVLIATLLFIAGSSYFIFQAFYQQYQQVMEIFQIVDAKIQHELVFNDILMRNVILLVGSILAYIVVMGVLIIRARHRYEGPLIAIARFIEDVQRGEYRHRIVIRKGDELQELVGALNKMGEDLEERHGAGLVSVKRAE